MKKPALCFTLGPSAPALAMSLGLLISVTASGQPAAQALTGSRVPLVDAAGVPVMAQVVPVLVAEELDKLVAPIALHPDPLLAQILPASTYPLEVVQASRWAQQHKGLNVEDLEAATAAEPWAASVKALCPFPDVLLYMDEHLDWTTRLGDAVLNQEQDVVEAIQRMRLLAQTAGTLRSNDKQIVEVEEVGDRRVVVIRPYEPELIYVPVYDPEVVYYRPLHHVQDDWAYGLFGFGAGVLASSMFWDWDCDWYGRRIVYDRDRYRRSHHRFDWDDYDWDRYDWRRGDRIHQGGFDFDIARIDIDNIDINRYDWRHTDLRRFDWNRADWRGVDFDRLEFGKRDWKDVDWAAAGIRNPHLVEGLRNLPPEDREQFRQRFEKAHGNQQYKDRIGKLQHERRLSDKAPEIQAPRWQHEPEHRRGVAYKGPAKERFEKRGTEGRREGVSQRPDGVGPGRADDARRRGGIEEAMRDGDGKPKGDSERSSAILKALRDRDSGKGKDASSRKGHGPGELKPSERATGGGGLKPTEDVRDAGSRAKGDQGDKERSAAILKALRDRELGGARLGASSHKGQGTGDLRPSTKATEDVRDAGSRAKGDQGDKERSAAILKALRDRELGGARLGASSRKGQDENKVVRSQPQAKETVRKSKDDDRSRQVERRMENRQPAKSSDRRSKVPSVERSKSDHGSGGQRSSAQKQPSFERKSSGGGDRQAKSNKGGSNQQVRSNKNTGGGDKRRGGDKDEDKDKKKD